MNLIKYKLNSHKIDTKMYEHSLYILRTSFEKHKYDIYKIKKKIKF